MNHNKEPEEGGGGRARGQAPHSTLLRNRLAINPAHLGDDELKQLLRVAKHIISFVAEIRPR